MNTNLVKPNERVDDLQNGFHVIQDPEKFCFGIDAVLLSDFAKVKKGETVLDMGTGTGIIPILLQAKYAGKHFTGLEIQKECAEMASRSVKYNNIEDKVSIVQGDIKEAAGIFGAASFHVVTCNPPYMERHCVTEVLDIVKEEGCACNSGVLDHVRNDLSK